MNKKNKSTKDGIVYSTDPGFRLEDENVQEETLSPAQQLLLIRLDTKNRAGKAVTLINGFTGKEEDLQELCKRIKNFCGTGGSAKEGEIIIQGDQRDKVTEWLQKNGYKMVKKK